MQMPGPSTEPGPGWRLMTIMNPKANQQEPERQMMEQGPPVGRPARNHGGMDGWTPVTSADGRELLTLMAQMLPGNKVVEYLDTCQPACLI